MLTSASVGKAVRPAPDGEPASQGCGLRRAGYRTEASFWSHWGVALTIFFDESKYPEMLFLEQLAMANVTVNGEWRFEPQT